MLAAGAPIRPPLFVLWLREGAEEKAAGSARRVSWVKEKRRGRGRYPRACGLGGSGRLMVRGAGINSPQVSTGRVFNDV